MKDTLLGWARRWGLGGTAAAVLAATLVAGCGGGGGGGGTGGTATAFASGPISGFGSIIVNGVRFDDSAAQVEDEDGGRSSSASLKLGTMVEIESERIDDGNGRAKALRIRFGSEIVGPVESTDSATNSFIVLGQTVELKPETVFDDSLDGTLDGLKDKVVEVHAQFDAATGHYVATRIEAEDNPAFYKLRGLVGALDKTAQTFKIGGALISYKNIAAADLPANFADGQRVRVRLQTTQQADDSWLAVTIRSGVRKVEDHDDARLRGTVSALSEDLLHFEINGLPVDASNARIDNGPLSEGARVEVRGSVKDGTIVATRVKVLRGDDDEIRGVELHGLVGDLSTAGKTFMLRGVKVDYGGTVLFKDGAEAQLADGVQVEVKGVLSEDRSTLKALVIEFER